MAWMDYHLVEFGGNRWRSIFTPKNLPNLSPGGVGLPKLSTDGLDVTVILRQKMPKVLKYFNPFKYIPVNSKLLPKSQC